MRQPRGMRPRLSLIRVFPHKSVTKKPAETRMAIEGGRRLGPPYQARDDAFGSMASRKRSRARSIASHKLLMKVARQASPRLILRTDHTERAPNEKGIEIRGQIARVEVETG